MFSHNVMNYTPAEMTPDHRFCQNNVNKVPLELSGLELFSGIFFRNKMFKFLKVEYGECVL